MSSESANAFCHLTMGDLKWGGDRFCARDKVSECAQLHLGSPDHHVLEKVIAVEMGIGVGGCGSNPGSGVAAEDLSSHRRPLLSRSFRMVSLVDLRVGRKKLPSSEELVVELRSP